MPNAASPFWWSATLAAIASLANLGLLVFAGVQVWREWKRDDRRIAAAAAQASNLGYLLRREIRALIGAPASREALEKWVRDAQSQGRYRTAMDEIAADAKALATVAPDAPEAISAAVQLVYVHVHEGLRRLEEYAATPRQSEDQSAALTDLEECVKTLETKVISPTLLNAEAILARRRHDETFDASITQIIEMAILRPERDTTRTGQLRTAGAPRLEQRRSLSAIVGSWFQRI
jgi:hypothetical protein